MSKKTPVISVIIPTHNRMNLLRRTLCALIHQTYSMKKIEVVVVADGSNDGTVEMLRTFESPYSLRVFEQSGQGAAKARNYGAAKASGKLLLFLDDDVEPTPSLIDVHVSTHRQRTDLVVLGYMPPVFPDGPDFLKIRMRSWWEEQFRSMQTPGHRFSYRNLFSGQFSLERNLFWQVGGFDPAFQCREDPELACRLLEAKSRFVFASQAVGTHHESATLSRCFTRARKEGQGDVLLGFRHRRVQPALALARFESSRFCRSRILYACVFTSPAVGEFIGKALRYVLYPLEVFRLRGLWQRLLGGLREFWYWRGVADALGPCSNLANYLQAGPARVYAHAEIKVDLGEGLEAAEARLDLERPDAAHLFYNQIYVGWMPPEAGAERLRGVHLRPALGCKLSSQLLTAITISKLKRNNQTMKALTRDPVQTFDVGKFPVDGLSKRLQSGHKDILVGVQK